jgi:response regulator RpfG family c-di-GMP phosphodiesterase
MRPRYRSRTTPPTYSLNHPSHMHQACAVRKQVAGHPSTLVPIVDDDQDISKIVAEVLSEEGFVISELRDARPAAIQAEVARLEPDVVLLDGGHGRDYGYSWVNAAWIRERSRIFVFPAPAAVRRDDDIEYMVERLVAQGRAPQRCL